MKKRTYNTPQSTAVRLRAEGMMAVSFNGNGTADDTQWSEEKKGGFGGGIWDSMDEEGK